MDEEHLWSQIRQGDQLAFERLFKLHDAHKMQTGII